jgi:putative membrane protein
MALSLAMPATHAVAAGNETKPLSENAEAAASLSSEDFVEIASTYDLFQVRAGQWALDKAQGSEVREFASAMVRQHETFYDELTQVHSDGIQFHLNDIHRNLLEQIKGTSNAEFDNKYLSQEVSMLRKAVDLYRGYAEGGDDAELKAYAKSRLPALKKSLEKAENLIDS